MRIAMAMGALALLAACGETRSPAPDGGGHGYLLFDPPSQQQGWELVDQLTTRSADKALIRTSGLADDGAKTMFIDFSGGCEAQAPFVAEARRAAKQLNIANVRCTETSPIS